MRELLEHYRNGRDETLKLNRCETRREKPLSLVHVHTNTCSQKVNYRVAGCVDVTNGTMLCDLVFSYMCVGTWRPPASVTHVCICVATRSTAGKAAPTARRHSTSHKSNSSTALNRAHADSSVSGGRGGEPSNQSTRRLIGEWRSGGEPSNQAPGCVDS